MWRVSSESSTLLSEERPRASAAMSSARFVMLLEPGKSTSALLGVARGDRRTQPVIARALRFDERGGERADVFGSIDPAADGPR